MKKIITMLFMAVLLVCPSAYALDSQMADVTVSYEVEGEFQVVFPSSIEVGEDFSLYVSEYNLPSDKCLQFMAESLYGDEGYIRLFNDEDINNGVSKSDASYVNVSMYADGNKIDLANRTLGYVYGSSDSIIVSTEYVDSSDGRAGSYSGIVSFCVNCVDQ